MVKKEYVGVIREKVRKGFETYRCNRDVEQLVFDMVEVADCSVGSQSQRFILDEEIRKEFNKENINENEGGDKLVK